MFSLLPTEQLCDECTSIPVLLYAQIAAIASRSLERAKDFAKKHGVPTAYSYYAELAGNPDIGETHERPGMSGTKTVFWRLLSSLCPNRRGVPGSAAHRALDSRPAVSGGREECAV